MKRQHISISFDLDQLAKLRQVAQKEDLTIAHLVRRATREWLRRQSSPKPKERA